MKRRAYLKALRLPLGISGGLALLAAITWWWLTYREVISYAFISPKEAGYCLIGQSTICDLARALCRASHPLVLIDYRPVGFWLAVILLSAAAFTSNRKSPLA